MDTGTITKPQAGEAQGFEQEQAGDSIEAPDLAEVAAQLNTQISDILSDFGVDELDSNDPEFAAFQQAIDDAIPQGNGAAILRAAAQAGKAKAARLAGETKGLSTRQLWDRAHTLPAEPETDLAAEGITGHAAAAVELMAKAGVYIEEGDPEFSYVKPHLDKPGPELVKATEQAIKAKKARTFTGRDYLERAHTY